MSHTRLPLAQLLVTTAVLIVLVWPGAPSLGARAGTAQTAAAQPAPPASAAPSWIRIDTVQVRPELWNQYRDIERDEVIPALRKAGVPSRAAWRTAEFGSTYEMVHVRPVPDFADYDGGDALTKGIGAREAERLRERIRRCLVSRDSAAVIVRSDLGAGETGRPFAVVTTLTVAPGRNEDYEAFLRETLPAAKKAGVVYGAYQRIYGQTAAWILVENLDTLRELSRGPGGLFRAFGEADAERRTRALSGIVTAVERKVFRFDPELSFSFQGPAQAR